MERVVVVLVAVAMLNAAAKAQDNTTTLRGYFLERYGETMHQMSLRKWWQYNLRLRPFVENYPGKVTPLPLTEEILQYLFTVQFTIMSEFVYDLENVTIQSIYEDLNEHCGEYLETPIQDLTDKPSVSTQKYRGTLNIL